MLAMALLLLSQVIPGNLEPFRGTELESGVWPGYLGPEWVAGCLGQWKESQILGLEPASQVAPLYLSFLIFDFYMINLTKRLRLDTLKFWCAIKAASSFSVIHLRVPRNFHSASRSWELDVQGLHINVEANFICLL